MARERKSFDMKWDGRACMVDELGAQAARQVARRLFNVVGKAMREGASSARLDTDLEIVAMLGIGAVLEQIDDATATWFTTVFAEVTLVENEAGTGEMVKLSEVQELAFRGSEGLARWARWLAFCVEQSCGDFFAEAFAELKRLRPAKAKAATATASGSPSTSSKPGSITA